MSLPNIQIVSQSRLRKPEFWPKTSLLATVTALLSCLALGTTAPRANAQAAAPPPPLTLSDPTTKPLVPNQVTSGTATAAFRYVSSEKQSPVNAWPMGLGDAQNRARGASDLYWGVLEGDVPWDQTPLARARVNDLSNIGAFSASSVAQGGLSEDYTSLITLDGWTFPRLSSQNGVFNPVFATNDPNFTAQNLFLQVLKAESTTDGVAPISGLVFASALGPSTGIQSTVGGVPNGTPTYFVASAIPRPAVDAVTYDAAQKFVWRLDNPQQTGAAVPTVVIPGAIGQQVRYRVVIHVPTPADGTETRVDDARYVVFYYAYQNGAYVPMQTICLASQITGGDLELKNLNGSTAFFPMFSTANFSAQGTVQGITLSAPQPTTGGTPVAGGTPIVQGVTLDNTSGNNTSGASIVADTITLEPSTDSVSSTPTITPPHGGAVVTNLNANAPTSPVILIQPQSYLPDLTDAAGKYHVAPQHYDPNNNTYNSVGPATGALASVQSFINNIDDTQYGGTNYTAYQPWNVSTVFQGPASLIDPRFAGIDSSNITYTGTGEQIGLVDTDITNRPQIDIPADPTNVPGSIAAGAYIFTPTAAVNATNNWVYGGTLADPTAANAPETPAPYFSHIQIVIARTEFAQDPNDPAGTGSIQVGAIYALDWQTGAPVWRFPDRSYLPEGATYRSLLIPGAGLRNPMIASDTTVTGVFNPVFQVPGIVAVDRNGDGFITDDEIYIGASQTGIINNQKYVTTAGNNVSGGVFTSVTIAPKVLVQGNVLVPVHPSYTTIENNFLAGLNTADITGTAPATPGRYYSAPGGGGPTGDYGAVPVGMAFIAAANGVLYAVDAYGNNDTRYFPGGVINNNGALNNPKMAPNGLYFGQYLPGTTNLFWSFSATVAAQRTTETTLQYRTRVLDEVPATNSFGGSSPVLAWNYTDTEIADYYAKSGAGYLTPPELRLFVGNTNGVVYALDPTATTGISINPQSGGASGTGTLPILKGVQPAAASLITYPATAQTAEHQGDLRWWFQTQGAINMPVAVSAMRHNMGAFGSDTRSAIPAPIIEKAVYVGTQEGHMYALDWDGPVTRPVPHSTFLASTMDTNGPTYTQQGFSAYDGTATAAAALNDDYYFHNILPATTTGIADQTYGNVRPRWTYPNLYFDIGATGTEKKPSDVPDAAVGVGPNGAEIANILLAPSSSLGPIATAPMLMDFWWADPDNTGTNTTPAPPSLVSYVAFTANDPTVLNTPATQSRVYLLDAIGDRVNLLTNPRATPSETSNLQRNLKRVISQPRDKYTPHALLASASDPTIPSGLTWTYRYQNDVYEAPTLATPPAPIAQTPFDVQLRNSPFYNGVQGGTLANPGYDFNINTLDPSTWMQNYLIQSGIGNVATTTINGYLHQPGRRMLPTLFVGGVGEAYALDIDPETALFMRWRPPVRGGSNPAINQEKFTPLPNRIIMGLDPYPGDPQAADANGNILFGSMAPEDALDPPDHVFDAVNDGNSPFGYSRSSLANNGLSDGGIPLGQQILARYYGLESQDESLITSLTVSGGPMQNRNNVINENGVQQAVPSIPAYPTNDVPNLRPFSVATVTPPSGPYGQYVGGNPSQASLNQATGLATNTLDFNGLPSSSDTGTVPLVPGGHVTGGVNQDINDPVTTKRGVISSLPASHPGIAEGQPIIYTPGATPPAIANATFQYPILFATTTGSFLHGMSTNIEGEDRQSMQVDGTLATGEGGDSRSISWSFLPGNPGRFNARHTQILLQFGPGGPSGIADMSNVYFPAIDPYALAYRNTVVTAPPTTTPYSLNETPNFIADEPNVQPVNNVPTTGTPSGPTGFTQLTVQDPDDPTHPRPDFKPRPLTAAQAASPGLFPATVSDTNTGDTGFPLDLNGLFFDRQFAGAASGTVPGVGGATQFPPIVQNGPNTFGYDANLNYNNDNQFPNGDYHVWLRAPGYSNVGARLVSPTSGANSGLGGPVGLPVYGDNNNQIAEGVRHNDLLDFGLVASPFPQIPTAHTGPGDVVSDDINPAGQNVAWIYIGSNNGIVYAYTPSIVGHESGFGGGEGFSFSGGGADDVYNGGHPSVGIFPASFVNGIIGSGNFGDVRQTAPSMTVAAQGGKNYYEWGETVYIVAYDILAQSFANTEAGQGSQSSASRFQRYVSGLGANGGTDDSVTIIVTDKSGGTQLTEHLSLRGSGDGTGPLITYFWNGAAMPPHWQAGSPANRAAGTPLGIAIYPYKLTGSPTQNQAQTPGSLLQVSVVLPAAISGGVAQGVATERPGYGVSAEEAQNEGIGSYFSIANPLALQGFLASTQPDGTGHIVPVSPIGNPGDYNPTNPNTGIGPFSSSSNQGLPGESGTSVKMDDSTKLDPNKVGAQYWQALTNGNTIQRIDLSPYSTYPALNQHFQMPVITSNGITEQPFYIPVMTSPGYVNHGTSGSTAVGTDSNTGLTQEYFRLLNRSLLGSLAKVRALPVDVPGDLLFRAWPGVLMNDDADAVGLAAGSGTNARNYPSVAANGIMDPFGRINPLLWESVPAEAKPWSGSAQVNQSPDYSDILSRTNNGTALQIVTASGDITSSPGTLTSVISPAVPIFGQPNTGSVNSTNTVVSQIGEGQPAIGANSGIQGPYRTAVSVHVPLYQPANLVAVPTATTTYLPANRADFPGGATVSGSPVIVGTPGPVQIPRGLTNRVLYQANIAKPQAALAPFGYTAKVVVFIDNDGTNRLVPQNSQSPNLGSGGTLNTGGKAYRIFEVWAGVPVDESLKISESTIDLGAAPHGMGMQNGLLGYNITGADSSLLPGFLPPLVNSPLGASVLPSPYAASFKPFTILGTGNVNLYNLRASQKVEANPFNTTLQGDGVGTGSPFSYFQLGSGTVDSQFGILAAGADPLLPGQTGITNPNVMPQIVTSIDRSFDVDWNGLIPGLFTSGINPYNATVAGDIGTYYQAAFAGRHPLPKALPNATSPSVFGIPAAPSATPLVIDNTLINVASKSTKPSLGISVPLGTPVGEYTSGTSNSPFSIWEDHDTIATYVPGELYIPTPSIVSGAGSISPVIGGAGPMYGRRNDQYPVTTGGAQVPILPTTGEGVWRAEAVTSVGNQYRFSYLPYTYPFLSVQVKVTESPLTGQFPDFAQPGGNAAGAFVTTGVLPSVDLYPLETAAVVGANNTAINRPSSALTPASWRDAAGNLHVYISRNATTTTATGQTKPVSGADPGAPYKLYESVLQWNATVGSWQAQNAGSPIPISSSSPLVLDPTKNTGHWFTTPSQLVTAPNTAINTGTDSDTSPFVLTHAALSNGGLTSTVDGATLFYMNSTPTISGAPSNKIYYVDVTNDGTGATTATPALYFTGGDPSLLRYTPRVAYASDTNGLSEDFLFYYGGQHGRWSIYYVPRTADNKGLPTGTAPDASVTANVETPIIVPDSIVSASEPAPVFHQIFDQRATSTTAGQLIDVMDVYYTGISRATQTPDIYMNRYRIASQITNGVTKLGLAPLALPRIVGEQLSAINHQSLWRAQNVAWISDLGLKNPTTPVLPVITIKTNGVTSLQTVDTNWQFDPASSVLYQVVGTTPKTLTYVYVDASAGTVRFRGASAPGQTDIVSVDYTPQAYRLTSDGASNFGPYTFTETRTLPPTVNPATNQVAGTASSPLLIRRQSAVPSGRNWLFWQKGATASNPPTLFSAERRVGLDLAPFVPSNQSVMLTVPAAANNYTETPVNVTVSVAEVPGSNTQTPVTQWEFEYGPSGQGRIYIDPQYEGLPITVNVQTVTAGTQGSAQYGANGQTQNVLATGIARYVDELNYSANNVVGSAVEIGTGLNEGQASAFLDLFDARGITRANNDPSPITDPALIPGKVWLFWSSPRGKANGGYPNGYNTYWEAIAPVFEAPLIPTPASK